MRFLKLRTESVLGMGSIICGSVERYLQMRREFVYVILFYNFITRTKLQFILIDIRNNNRSIKNKSATTTAE